MRQPAATADQIVYFIRRHVAPRPPENKINPARDRRLSLTAIGHLLKDEYNALPPAVPPHLAVLIEQLKKEKYKSLGNLICFRTGDEWNRSTRQFIPEAARLVLPGGLCASCDAT